MRIVSLLMILLLAVLHTPTSALALVPSFLSDLLPVSTNEPVMLLVTGLTLLSIARIGGVRHRSTTGVNTVAHSLIAPARRSAASSPKPINRAA